MMRKKILNGDLLEICRLRLKECSDCPPAVMIAIAAGVGDEWSLIYRPHQNAVWRYPLCSKRAAELEKELQFIYRLPRNK